MSRERGAAEVSQSNPAAPRPRFGKYSLIKRLGVGGMAEAWLARSEGASGFQKLCVVKRMLPHIAEDDQFVRMFHAEAKVAALLTHTNVVQIYELGEIDKQHFIAMEYVDGCALHVLARSSWHRNMPLPIEVACCAVADAALGLSAAHELTDPETGAPLNVVHRDISPDNLMINKEGVTKILDFGVAKQTGSEKTVAGELRGKIPFLSPEQIRGKKIDRRADIYALGVTFYWLVTGRRPFHADNEHALMHTIVTVEPVAPKKWNRALPDEIDQLIMGMLEKNPDKRPSDADVVHDALADHLKSRRSITVPFVRDILAGEIASNSPMAMTPAFVQPKSSPQARVAASKAADDDEALYDVDEDASERATTAPNPIVMTQPNTQPTTQPTTQPALGAFHDAPTQLRPPSSSPSNPSGKSAASPGRPSTAPSTAAPAPSGKSPPSPGRPSTAAPAPSGKSPPSPGQPAAAAPAPSGKSPPSLGAPASGQGAISAALQGDGLATVSLTSADVEAAMAQAHAMMVENEKRMAEQAKKDGAQKAGATFDDTATVRLTSEDIAAALASIKPGVLEASLAGATSGDAKAKDVSDATGDVSSAEASFSSERTADISPPRVAHIASAIAEAAEEPPEPTMIASNPIEEAEPMDEAEADDADVAAVSAQADEPVTAPSIQSPTMQALLGRHTPATPARSIERPVERSGPIAASPGRPSNPRPATERSGSMPASPRPAIERSAAMPASPSPSSPSSPASPAVETGKSGEELHQLLESMAPDALLHGSASKKSALPVPIAAAAGVGAVLLIALIAFIATRGPDTPDVPVETPVDVQPADLPADVKPTDVKPTDVKPVDKPNNIDKPKSVQTNPFNNPVDVKPTDKRVVKPVDKPVDVKPVDQPANVKPVDKPKPVDKSKPTTPPEVKVIDVKTQGPAGIQWLLFANPLGKGAATFKVPSDTTSLVAVEPKRGGRATVPIVNGVANYAALPTGKIHPRANPFAEVFLGNESLGTTPFPAVEVVAGKYTLRFVSEGKEQKRTVDVNGGETVKVAVDFTAP